MMLTDSRRRSSLIKCEAVRFPAEVNLESLLFSLPLKIAVGLQRVPLVILAFLFLITALLLAHPAEAATVEGSRPVNVTILYSTPFAVCFTWHLTAGNLSPSKLRIQAVYKPVGARYRVLSDISGSALSATLANLLPSTQYRLVLTSYHNSTAIGSSPEIFFHTPSNYGAMGHVVSTENTPVTLEEICIVVIVLCVWMLAIVLFFNRWGKIRMLEPYEYNFKYHYPAPDMPPLAPSCPHTDAPLSPLLRGSLDRHYPSDRPISTLPRRCSSLSAYMTGHPLPLGGATSTTPEVKVSLSDLGSGRRDETFGRSSISMVSALVHDSAV